MIINIQSANYIYVINAIFLSQKKSKQLKLPNENLVRSSEEDENVNILMIKTTDKAHLSSGKLIHVLEELRKARASEVDVMVS